MEKSNEIIKPLEKTPEQNEYRKYLEGIRLNENEFTSNLKWADYMSVKDTKDWKIINFYWKKINSYLNVQIQKTDENKHLIPVWKEYTILVDENKVYNINLENWNLTPSKIFKIDNLKINLIDQKEVIENDEIEENITEEDITYDETEEDIIYDNLNNRLLKKYIKKMNKEEENLDNINNIL